MMYTAELTLELQDPTVADMADAVCSQCGERLELVDGQYRHSEWPDTGRTRDHRPRAVDPGSISASKGLAHLYQALAELEAATDPALRDRIAVEIAAMAPRVMLQVRREAAKEAVKTMRAATYARRIRRSRQAVDKLLAGR